MIILATTWVTATLAFITAYRAGRGVLALPAPRPSSTLDTWTQPWVAAAGGLAVTVFTVAVGGVG